MYYYKKQQNSSILWVAKSETPLTEGTEITEKEYLEILEYLAPIDEE